MLTIDGLSLSISKGDTGIVSFDFSENVPPDGSIARVTLKRHLFNVNPIWEKEITVQDGQISFYLAHEDTNFPSGKYWWDIRLIDGDSVITPISPQVFTILEVVGSAD